MIKLLPLFLFSISPLFALEYTPLVADDLPIMHILVINSTIVALYCIIKLITMFFKILKA